MQISEKSIQDTIDSIVGICRRGTSECHSEFMVDDYYWHTRSQLQGLRFLFVDCSKVLSLIDAARLETDVIRAEGKARLVDGQLAS